MQVKLSVKRVALSVCVLLLIYRAVHQNDATGTKASRRSSSSLLWEWERFSQGGNSTDADSCSQKNPGAQPRVLVAQQTSHTSHQGDYYALLNASSVVNRAYAKRQGYDYVIMRGIGVTIGFESDTKVDSSRSTYNKLSLLHHALDCNYNWLWILDADALVTNLDVKVPQIMNTTAIFMAHHVHPDKPLWNINIGVTIWNLQHPKTKQFVRRWYRRSLWRIVRRRRDDDQRPLQAVLRVYPSFQRHVQLDNDMSPFYQHFTRGNSLTHGWTATSIQRRVEKIRAVTTEVCQRYQLSDC